MPEIEGSEELRLCKGCNTTQNIGNFYLKKGHCKNCKTAYRKTWNKNNPNYHKEYYRKNANISSIRNREWLKKAISNNPDYEKERNRKKNYGISVDGYIDLIKEQAGLCAICKLPETRTRGRKITSLSVDHNHTTGQVRGLLCNACNAALGYLKEDVKVLRAMIKYINKWSTKANN